MIIYFTGTGNSRYVAERIAEATGDTIIDSAEYIRNKNRAAFDDTGSYVFVSPTYVSAPPIAFMEFIREADFPAGSKAYFIMTAASSMSACPVFCKSLADEKGFDYMGTGQVVMPQNYIAYFKMGTAEENRRKLEDSEEQIGELAGYIENGRRIPEIKRKLLEQIAVKIVIKPYYRLFISAKKFKADGRCVSCGKCARVCPLGNIEMVSGKPVWGNDCTHCMGCINLCPEDAIEYGSKTVNKLRYHGPESVRY